ncbi:MAG: hypothetical protein PHT53_05625 [Candidatus Omnitrophica bacterium]|nr:hypothetical protein [Candidatus Omnitrophota bacterium]
MQAKKPVIKALLVCDYIITDRNGGKNSLIGIFENINCKTFPHIHGNLGVYVNFSDALGDYEFKLELIDLSNNEAIGHSNPIKTNFNDTVESFNLAFLLSGLKFDHPGKYLFKLSANGEGFGTAAVNVIQI